MTIERLLDKRNTTEINIVSQVEKNSLQTQNYLLDDCDCNNCGDCVCFCACDCGICDGLYKEVIQ